MDADDGDCNTDGCVSIAAAADRAPDAAASTSARAPAQVTRWRCTVHADCAVECGVAAHNYAQAAAACATSKRRIRQRALPPRSRSSRPVRSAVRKQRGTRAREAVAAAPAAATVGCPLAAQVRRSICHAAAAPARPGVGGPAVPIPFNDRRRARHEAGHSYRQVLAGEVDLTCCVQKKCGAARQSSRLANIYYRRRSAD